jgi:hypothetical protein
VLTSEFIAENAQCGTFYNHLSAVYKPDVSDFTTSGLSEDLGIFEIKSKKEFKDLRRGLAYLKSYVLTNKIAGSKTTILDDDFTKTVNSKNFEEFTKKLGFTNVSDFLESIKKGTFVIKLSDSTNEYAQSHGSIDK